MNRVKMYSVILLVIGLLAAALGGAFYMTGTSTERPPKTYDDYMREGRLYYESGDYAKATVSYEDALALQDRDSAALEGLAAVYAKQVNTLKELDLRREIAEVEPDNIDNHIRIIELMVNGGKLREAKEETEKLLTEVDSDALRSLYQEMTVEAPVFNLQAGSFDDYQLLELSNSYDNATVHYTTDGSEPTAKSPVFLDGVVISYPETHFRAKAIGVLGYESEVTKLDFTVTRTAEVVSRAGTNADDMVGMIGYYVLNKPWDTEVYNYELAQIRELYVLGDEIVSGDAVAASFYNGFFQTPDGVHRVNGSASLDFVDHMPFLKTLVVSYQNKLDLRPLASLHYLERLSLLNDGITDLSPLQDMNTLTMLALGWNQIKDISPLRDLTDLQSLALWNNQIDDISALSELKNLTRLDISYNRVQFLDPVSGMTNLSEIWINNNEISDVTPLADCRNLIILMQGGNQISDFSSILYLKDQLNKSDVEWRDAA